MRIIMVLSILLSIACAKEPESKNPCPNTKDVSLLSELSFKCLVAANELGHYRIVVIVGGDPALTDEVAYKADYRARIQWAKSHSTYQLLFSTPQGTEDGIQRTWALEAASQEALGLKDLFSESIVHPLTFENFIYDAIESRPAL